MKASKRIYFFKDISHFIIWSQMICFTVFVYDKAPSDILDKVGDAPTDDPNNFETQGSNYVWLCNMLKLTYIF